LRYLTADYIFPVSQAPIKNGVVVIDDEGRISAINQKSKIKNQKIETYSGIICPGFVNAHCHLELSHMKGAITQKTGLSGFIKDFIAARRRFSAEEIERGIEEGEREMMENGIVAVGDICNVADTFRQKAKKNLKYYNFIEGFDFFPENTEAELKRLKDIIDELRRIIPGADYAVVPHAPYSVSERLFSLLPSPWGEGLGVRSIHNQESEEENKMFGEKKGKIIEFFISLGMDFSRWKESGKSSLQTYLGYLPKGNKWLLVHNTFTDAADIKSAEAYSQNIYWVTCPNANLYIENKLPDYNLFINAGAKMCIGTDSLASNHSLSVLEEMKTISSHFLEIKLETLLEWGTLNGAKALGFEDELGSFEAGKKPGVVLIEGVDLEKMGLTENSRVKKIV